MCKNVKWFPSLFSVTFAVFVFLPMCKRRYGLCFFAFDVKKIPHHLGDAPSSLS